MIRPPTLTELLLITLVSGVPATLAAEPPDSSEDLQEVHEEPLTEFDRDHWAFAPLEKPRPPSVVQVSWPRNAVDAFILSELERRELAPSPEAPRQTLIRRLKFDVLGLPPTPEETAAFTQDASPVAYERLVDQMLSSPGYGERWAQHWLDLARFAETDGFEHDLVRAEAWQYRQWVVDALNRDLPYDQFVGDQLAGDLIGGEQDAVATTFCLAGPDMPDINEQDLRRHDKLNELTATVGSAILGLQFQCAQCHDHKYDPISQADFYRLRGIFESAVPAMKRDRPVSQLLAQSAPVSPWIYFRGDLSRRGPRLEPRPPRIACSGDTYESFDGSEPRPAFVKWLFDEDNPLTARVMVNRIWQHHFGKSLCGNPSDFGVVASGPSHPELLDWLAEEFRQSQWSIKHLHRVILLSATYRQAGSVALSGVDATASITADPDNRWYSRFPRRRLEGEVIRDALLAVSGQLSRDYGGPSVMPPLPTELLQTLLPNQWQTSENPSDHSRRSIYVFARRNLRFPIFDTFDRPDAGTSCAQRDRSTTALQSLQMLNSELAFDAAEKLRTRLLDEIPTDSPPELVVERLFLIAFSRSPTPGETAQLTEALGASPSDRCANLLPLCLAMLNASEFVYVD